METKARIKLHLLLSFVCFQVENSTFACCRCRRRRCCRRSCRCRRCRCCSRVSLLLLPPLGNLIFDKVDLFSKLPPVSFRSSRKEKKSSHLNQDFFCVGNDKNDEVEKIENFCWLLFHLHFVLARIVSSEDES